MKNTSKILFLYSSHKKDLTLKSKLEACLYGLWEYIGFTLGEIPDFEVSCEWLDIANLAKVDYSSSIDKVIWVLLISPEFLNPCHSVYPNKGLEILKQISQLDQSANIILPVHLKQLPNEPGWGSLPIGHLEEIPNRAISSPSRYHKDEFLNQIAQEILEGVKIHFSYDALLHICFKMLDDIDLLKSTEDDFRIKVDDAVHSAYALDVNHNSIDKIKKIILKQYQSRKQVAMIKFEKNQRREEFYRKMFPYIVTITLIVLGITTLILIIIPPRDNRPEPSHDIQHINPILP